MTDEGSLGLALAAALLFFGGLWFETRVVLRWKHDGWFLVGLPLPGSALVRLPGPPRAASGATPSVRWERSRPNLVRWWADPTERKAPSGLHGCVLLVQGQRGVELVFRWSPPWTLLLAPAWLAGLGVARGEPQVGVPIGALVLVGVLVAYGASARGIAAELRWAFLERGEL